MPSQRQPGGHRGIRRRAGRRLAWQKDGPPVCPRPTFDLQPGLLGAGIGNPPVRPLAPALGVDRRVPLPLDGLADVGEIDRPHRCHQPGMPGIQLLYADIGLPPLYEYVIRHRARLAPSDLRAGDEH